MLTASEKRPRPVSRRKASLRGIDLPIIEFMSYPSTDVSTRTGPLGRFLQAIVVEEAKIERVYCGWAQSIEHLGDVLDANTVLDSSEVMIANGGDDREIRGNGGHHQKIYY